MAKKLEAWPGGLLTMRKGQSKFKELLDGGIYEVTAEEFGAKSLNSLRSSIVNQAQRSGKRLVTRTGNGVLIVQALPQL